MIIAIPLGIQLKARSWANLAQLLTGIVVVTGYYAPMLKCLFVLKTTFVKTNFHTFEKILSEPAIWLHIEFWYFLLWVTSMALFCLGAYLAKFKSLFKRDFQNDSNDDDVWSKKSSDDFLRYFKWEAFTFTLAIS